MVKLAKMLWRSFTAHAFTILITEPDPMLRRLERRALSPKYQIVETSTGEEAVRIAARHDAHLDLLLTEARLPRMEGWNLVELLKMDYPSLKVVYVANSIDAEIRAHTRRATIVVQEKNRFNAGRLQSAVRDVLETRRKDNAKFPGTRDKFFSRFRHAWAKR